MATAGDTHPVEPRPAEAGNPSLNDVAAGTNGLSDSGATTRQLDFYQAMRDFKLMFPNMDEDVIEAVLRANHGAVDDTIDQLLTMNVDNDVTVPHERPSGAAIIDGPDQGEDSPIYMNQDLIKVPTPQVASSASSSEVGSPPQYEARGFDPPSYTDCLSNSAKASPSHSATPPKTSATDLLATLGGAGSLDSGLTLDTIEGATGYTPKSEQTSVKQAVLIDEDVVPPPMKMPPMMSLLNHDYTGKAHGPAPARPKRRYRDWNPPMLGTLPDDFLRFTVTPPSTPERHANKPHSHHSTPEHLLHHTPHHHHHHTLHHHSSSVPTQQAPVPPPHHHHTGSTPTHHHLHHHHHTMAPAASPQQQAQHHTPQRVKPSPQRSHTLHGAKHKSSNPQVARSQSLRNEPGTITVLSSRKNPNIRTVTATHGSEEISSNLIQRKILENERARTCSTEKMTPEQAQMLEDERLALLSQNGEFLTVLQRDTDFMRTLERDRMNATAFEGSTLDPNPTEHQEGYGTDHQSELGAFPFSKPLHKDEEFRRQLSHMGGLSKKKFAAIAKKFFSRKKKQKKDLKDSAAPSTANLLEEDDTDDELEARREAVHTEERPYYGTY